MNDLTLAELEAGIPHVRDSPSHEGRLEMIVRRPAVDERELLVEARLDTENGVVGDTWRVRGSRRTEDGSADPRAQVTLMNVRAAELVARVRDRCPLAGDQLYMDFDLSHANLPAGTRLEMGTAVVVISSTPHLGCDKFMSRFGKDALRFVNSTNGRELRLRGANARVVVSGTVRVGDAIRKVPRPVEAQEMPAPHPAPAV